MNTLVDLVNMINQPEGVHKINTMLLSVSFPQLRVLQELALESDNYECRVVAIILDIANYGLFESVRSDVLFDPPRNVIKIRFRNKAIDAINLPAILRSKSVAERIPVYLRNKEPPITSYEYTDTIASKLFNFASALSNLDITNYLSSPHGCQCETSKFCYKPHRHVITGDLMVIENVKLRELVSKCSKYREPIKINWSATEKSFSESIGERIGCGSYFRFEREISITKMQKFLTKLMSKTPWRNCMLILFSSQRNIISRL